MAGLAETDLYKPIYNYLTGQGYQVHGEVKDCDIVAIKDEDMVIIELKKTFSVQLLIQASQRQRITNGVYVALPRPSEGLRGGKWRGIKRLLKRLELGLIFINFSLSNPVVEIIFHPRPYRPRKDKRMKVSLIKEIEGRYRGANLGGSSKKEIMTAYRENAIFIACALESTKGLSSAQLMKMGTGSKTYSILYKNYYGWFERISRGMYGLSEEGHRALEKYPEIIEYYKCKLENDSKSFLENDSKGL